MLMEIWESKGQLLMSAVESGIINIDDVQKQMNIKKRQKILALHPYSVWQLSDGRWRTYLPDDTKKNKRKAITKTKKEDLEEAIIKNVQGAEKQHEETVRSLYPEWLEYKAQHLPAESSVTRIEVDWKKFYLNNDEARVIDRPIRLLTKLELDKWIHQTIRQYSMTKTAYYNFSIIIRQVLDYAVDLELITENPMRNFKVDPKMFRRVKKKADETQVFSNEEFRKIHQLAWDDFKNRVKTYELSPLAVLFQFETGLRIGELCVVRYEDIEQPDYIHIQRMLRKQTGEVVDHTKTDCGDRQVYLTEEARRLVAVAKQRQTELCVPNDGYIFSINSLPLIHYPVEELYRKYCDKLGITQKSSHKARKTYISALIDGQVNINTVRSMAGHSDERTTYGNYVFDRHTRAERNNMIEMALNHKVDSREYKVDSKG